MQRPKFVSEAISTADGLHVGHYGPFSLHSAYQPIFGCTDQGLSLVAMEGLVRPQRDGLPVLPEQLFDAVEPQDRLFVECMCRALHLRNHALAQPANLSLFINVNPATYESVEVVDREFDFMFSILGKYGVAAENLVCEIIETEALSIGTLDRLCAKFRAQGARIAIDDFGSGASGMERYQLLKPDVVKMDGDLFRAMAADPRRRKLLHSMAKTFVRDGAIVLVEGVETAEQLELAIALGASLFQGYGLGRPQALPATFPVMAALQPAAEMVRKHAVC